MPDNNKAFINAVLWLSMCHILWHHHQYCDINQRVCSVIHYSQIFMFYYWYFFNLIEIALNVENEWRFREKTKTNAHFYNYMKKDLGFACSEMFKTKDFKETEWCPDQCVSKFHISIFQTPSECFAAVFALLSHFYNYPPFSHLVPSIIITSIMVV